MAQDCSADPACLTLYERAKNASNLGDPEEALRLYKLAHEVTPDPLLLFSIARIHHKQGRLAEAVPFYRRFLAAPTDDPVPRRKAEEYLREISQVSAQPAIEPQDGKLQASHTGASSSVTDVQPVSKKWWFWTLIGVGAAGTVAAGVAIGVTTTNRNSEIPDGIPSITWTF